MGFYNTGAWLQGSAFAGGNAGFNSKVLAYYHNTSSVKKRVKSITFLMGSGVGTFTWGDDATGNGAAFDLFVKAKGITSGTISVDKDVGAVSGSGGTYPDKADMNSRTISFSGDPLIVDPDETISFLYASNSQQSSSTVFCWNADDISGSTETYKETYTVSYDTNGGSATLPDQDYAKGTEISLPSPGTRTDYTFNGWEAGTTTYIVGASYTVNSDVEFKAKWTKDADPPDPVPPIYIYQDGEWHNLRYQYVWTGGSWMKISYIRRHNGSKWVTIDDTP